MRCTVDERLSELVELAGRVCDGAAWDSDAAELERGLVALLRDMRRSLVADRSPASTSATAESAG